MNRDLFNRVTLTQCIFSYQNININKPKRFSAISIKNKVYEKLLKTSYFWFKILEYLNDVVNLKHRVKHCCLPFSFIISTPRSGSKVIKHKWYV